MATGRTILRLLQDTNPEAGLGVLTVTHNAAVAAGRPWQGRTGHASSPRIVLPVVAPPSTTNSQPVE